MLFHDSRLITWFRADNPLHSWCVETVTQSPQLSHPFIETLVCGLPVQHGATKALLAQTQLLHFFVISGLHLATVLYLSRKLDRCGQLFAMLIVWLMSGCAVPVTRALVSSTLAPLHRHLEVSKCKHELVTTIVSFLWCQSTTDFYSLVLSTTGAVAVQTNSPRHSETLPLSTHIWCWLGMSPWLLAMTGTLSSPLTIFIQIAVGPFLTWMILPLAVVGFIAVATYNFLRGELRAAEWLAESSVASLELADSMLLETVKLFVLWVPNVASAVRFQELKIPALLLGTLLLALSFWQLAHCTEPKDPLESRGRDSHLGRLQMGLIGALGIVLVTSINQKSETVTGAPNIGHRSKRPAQKCNEVELKTQKWLMQRSQAALDRGPRGSLQKIKKRNWPCRESGRN